MKAVRITEQVVRSLHPGIRVYISMDHYWDWRGMNNYENPLKALSGRKALELINYLGKLEGEFPWHVAFHAYPEHLFEPRFWRDSNVHLSLDTPIITF